MPQVRRLGSSLGLEPVKRSVIPALLGGAILGAVWLSSEGRTELGHAGLGRARLSPAQKRAVAARRLVPVTEARKRIRKRGRAIGTELPEHVRPYAEFLVRSSAREPTPRDIAKAFLITRASVRRQSRPAETVCRYWPELGPLRGDMRPEDAMSRLLFSKWGKRFLDAAQRGRYDHQIAHQVAQRMGCFGMGLELVDDMRTATELARRSDEVVGKLRGSSPEEWISYVEKSVPGVSAAKAGFFASLLGRGDLPTFDARELNLWHYRRQREPDAADVLALRDRLTLWRMRLEPRYEPFRQHLIHHTLWDAYGEQSSETTHEDMIRAMEFAGTRR